jgi:hypothetical protein
MKDEGVLMEKDSKDKYRIVFYAGVFAMVLLIAGVFSEPSSLSQKTLFLSGSVVLAIVAYLNRQKMLLSLQVITTVGSILAFLELVEIFKYAVLFVASVLVIAYLLINKIFKTDPWSMICTIGLILIAVGYVTDAGTSPILFGLTLGLGGLLVAFYSFLDYYYKKNGISVIWLVLNIIFAINPILMVISIFNQH